MTKGNLQEKKLFGNISNKNLSASLYSNFIILVLVVIVAYLSFSLYSKFSLKNSTEIEIKKASSPVIQVEVLNGCGLPGTADKITDYLRQHHFDVVQVGNYISYDIERSMVIDRTGNMANAYRVADSLGINRKNVVQQMSDKYFLDVTFVIGKDFNSLKPYQ